MVHTAIMKTLVILGLLFAYVHARSKPLSIQVLALSAITKCIQETSVDFSKIKVIMSKDGLPLDNPDLIKFFPCYWGEFGIITSDGNFDDNQIQLVFSEFIRENKPNATNPEKIVEDAINHCKPNIQGDSVALKGINYRNCLQQYITQKLQ